MTGTTSTQSTSTPMSWAPFVPLNTEPTTMDVDATHICEEYLWQMCGRCWGCGSTIHTRKEGNHDHDLCGYCKKVGHWETVCLDKFMARGRKQKAAATVENSSSSMNFSLDLSNDESEDIDLVMLDATTLTTLDDLKEQQKVLMEKIVALKKDFWRRYIQRPLYCCLRTYMLQAMIPHLVWPVVIILTLASSLNWICQTPISKFKWNLKVRIIVWQ